jgi:hypothetical protein
LLSVAHLTLVSPSFILDHGADCSEMVILTILPLYLYLHESFCLYEAINKCQDLQAEHVDMRVELIVLIIAILWKGDQPIDL